MSLVYCKHTAGRANHEGNSNRSRWPDATCALLLATLIALVNNGCSGRPSEDTVKQLISQHIKRNGNLVKLVSLRKTNVLTGHNSASQETYTMECELEVEFTEDFEWNSDVGRVFPAQAGHGKAVKKGEQAKVPYSFFFYKTSNGWRSSSFSPTHH